MSRGGPFGASHSHCGAGWSAWTDSTSVAYSQYPPQRVTTALRLVRVGRFDRARLFHLADLDDQGATTEEPLKGIIKNPTADADIRKSFARMRRAITVAMPDVSVSAGVWIDKLEEMLTKALAKGVGHLALGKFYRACMLKVSTPVLRYVGGSGRVSTPRFDMAFLEETSEARDEFKDAIYERHAPEASKQGRDTDDVQPLSKKQRKAAAAAAATAAVGGGGGGGAGAKLNPQAAAALKEYNAAAGKRVAGVAAGAMVPMPKDKKDDSMVAFRAAYPPVSIKGVGSRPVCWNYVHPQGCNKGAECTFAHTH